LIWELGIEDTLSLTGKITVLLRDKIAIMEKSKIATSNYGNV
jgi:hypothetical protein